MNGNNVKGILAGALKIVVVFVILFMIATHVTISDGKSMIYYFFILPLIIIILFVGGAVLFRKLNS